MCISHKLVVCQFLDSIGLELKQRLVAESFCDVNAHDILAKAPEYFESWLMRSSFGFCYAPGRNLVLSRHYSGIQSKHAQK